MQWVNQAIILSVKKFQETTAIVNLFTEEYGLHSGLVRSYSSKKNYAILQIGTIVEANWNARISEQLGTLNLELVSPIIPYIIDNELKLSILSSICNILNQTLPERHKEEKLFSFCKDLISNLKYSNLSDYELIARYIFFELHLLTELGFGLDFSKCAATGTTSNLNYLSPRSGQAVCSESAKPYLDKLFILPSFIKNNYITKNQLKSDELKQGLQITHYFIEKHLLLPKRLNIPIIRKRLTELIVNSVEDIKC